uniref:Hsp20/alpha crystallin family protein n=1 Tax=candidate division WOR-3 bacterium TaxID=2052148 RepID=A0A7V1EHH8_UNCW3
MRQNKMDTDKMGLSEIRVIYEKEDAITEEYGLETFINWQPLYDLYIIDETISIIIELPGVEMKDITIYVGQNHMTISGIKRSAMIEKRRERQNVVFHNLEIAYGRFFRTIEFPLPVEPKYGSYRLKQGVLTIKFPVLKEYIIPIEEE